MPNTLQQHADGLEALGTAAAIAEHLRTQGIKGNRMDSCSCAVARYLEKKIGQQVSVGPWTASELGGRHQEASWHPNTALHDFIRKFDINHYPDLVEEHRD